MSEMSPGLDPDSIRERVSDSIDEETLEEGAAEIAEMLAAYREEKGIAEPNGDSDPDEDRELTEEEIEGVFDEGFGAFLDLVRKRSENGDLTIEEDWVSAEIIPSIFSQEEFSERMVTYLDDSEMASELEYDDIVRLKGTDQVYFYSTTFMSENFARMAFLGSEKDDIITFVEMVRHESKLYPRPLISTTLMNHPLRLDEDRIDEAFERISKIEEYADIQECYASNGDRYFYSTNHLIAAQAKSLAEWYSVEKVLNP